MLFEGGAEIGVLSVSMDSSEKRSISIMCRRVGSVWGNSYEGQTMNSKWV